MFATSKSSILLPLISRNYYCNNRRNGNTFGLFPLLLLFFSLVLSHTLSPCLFFVRISFATLARCLASARATLFFPIYCCRLYSARAILHYSLSWHFNSICELLSNDNISNKTQNVRRQKIDTFCCQIRNPSLALLCLLQDIR